MADPRHFYSGVAAEFDALMNPYDLERRLAVVFDELLPFDLSGRRLLDAGCGTGWFSQRAAARGASVVSLDIGVPLLGETRRKVDSLVVAGDALSLPFAAATFDVVVSSEMIEHTFDPAAAVGELARVLRPGGTLALTCPNRSWQWLVRLASRLKLRPFQGIENFLSFNQLERAVAAAGLRLTTHRGLHPWPFQLRPLWRLSRAADRACGGSWPGRYMVNQAVRAEKP